MRKVKRPKLEEVVQAIASQEGRDEVIADFVKGIGAPSRRLSTCSLWATWTEFHDAAVPVLPITVEKVFCVSACFQTWRLPRLQDLSLQSKGHARACRPAVGDAAGPRLPQGSALRLEGSGRVEAVPLRSMSLLRFIRSPRAVSGCRRARPSAATSWCLLRSS